MEERIETKEIKKKKKNRFVIILTVILVILLLGATVFISYKKGMLDRIIKKEAAEEAKQEELVEGYQFRLKEINCQKEEHACTKELKVAYDEKNHDLKIKYLQKIEEQKDDSSIKHNNLYYQLYFDDELVDEFTSGSLYLDPDNTNYDKEYDMNFDGYIYIFNKKYLGFLFATRYPAGSGGYSLALYNSEKRVGEPEIIDMAAQSFGTYKTNNQLDGIDNISFDGTSLKYWLLSCEKVQEDIQDDEGAPTNIAEKLELTFDGQKAIKTRGGEKEYVNGGGASGCYDSSANTFGG